MRGLAMVQKFSVENTEIEGLKLITPFVSTDERGYFIKDYSKEFLVSNNITHDIAEVFYTSSHKGVIRAIHFQREFTQPKLVRCVKGHIFDIVVDLRKGSVSYGKWQGFDLSEKNKKELLIPGYCGHGYLVLEESIVSYKCAEKFYGEYDDGIIWNDPDININWPLEKVDTLILSDKDKNLQTFKEFTEKYKGL